MDMATAAAIRTTAIDTAVAIQVMATLTRRAMATLTRRAMATLTPRAMPTAGGEVAGIAGGRPSSLLGEETSTRPVGRCLTSVYLQYWRASSGTHFAAWCPVCSVALSGQAPTPHSGAPKARGLTAKARTEQSSALPQCAWLSNTVREIEYQFLHLDQPDLPPSTSPAVPSATAWDQLDKVSRMAALEILARLIARMLAPEPKEASDE